MDNKNQLVKTIVIGIVVVLVVAGGIIYLLVRQVMPTSVQITNTPSTPSTDTTPSVNVNFGEGSVKVQGNTPAPAPKTSEVSSLSSISPVAGRIGTLVTLYGSGFSASGNTIIVNRGADGLINNVLSTNGTTITVRVPATILVNGIATPVESGVYNVSVRNASGKVSNSVIFGVTE